MALIKCPNCGHAVADIASKCPNCGEPIAAAGAMAGKVVGSGLNQRETIQNYERYEDKPSNMVNHEDPDGYDSYDVKSEGPSATVSAKLGKKRNFSTQKSSPLNNKKRRRNRRFIIIVIALIAIIVAGGIFVIGKLTQGVTEEPASQPESTVTQEPSTKEEDSTQTDDNTQEETPSQDNTENYDNNNNSDNQGYDENSWSDDSDEQIVQDIQEGLEQEYDQGGDDEIYYYEDEGY